MKFSKIVRKRFGKLLLACAMALSAAGVFPVHAAQPAIADYVQGRVVLDVENHGEAWYVSPLVWKRYSLGRPEQAFEVMRNLGLGISDADLAGIPVSNQPDMGGDHNLRERLSGRILLQVEGNGEAWYVFPGNLRRYYLGRPADAFAVMRDLGLGITSSNLTQIPTGAVLPPVTISGVPFIAQAPLGEWNDIRQQEGCEEASVLMAMSWVNGQVYGASDARNQIIGMAAAETRDYGTHQDTSAQDTVDRLFKEYFGYHQAQSVYDVTAADIVSYLQQGKLVIAVVNGRTLNNPYFSQPAPARHMLVVTGFDPANDEFITHEPGTRNGAYYRYSYDEINKSLRDYASGAYEPIPEPPRSAIIIVTK